MAQVKLCYAIAQVGNVVHKAFRLCDADKLMPENMRDDLAHEVGVSPHDLRLDFDCVLVDLPDSVVAKIRAGKS